MSTELECPKCGEMVVVAKGELFVDCPECKSTWRVDYDGEFVDGSWRDLTKFHKSRSSFAITLIVKLRDGFSYENLKTDVMNVELPSTEIVDTHIEEVEDA